MVIITANSNYWINWVGLQGLDIIFKPNASPSDCYYIFVFYLIPLSYFYLN